MNRIKRVLLIIHGTHSLSYSGSSLLTNWQGGKIFRNVIDFTKLIKRNICKNQNIKEQECWYNSSYRIQRQTDNHQRNVYERKEIYLGVAEQDLVPMRHMILHLHCSQYLQKNNMQDWFSKLDDRYSLNIYVMS